MRNTSTRSKISLLFVAFAMMLALPAMALADTLQVNNTLVVGSNVAKDPGQSGTGKVWLATDDNNTDTRNGCNATATAPVTVTFSSSDTSKIANPASVRLTDCGTDHAADFSYNVASSAAAGTVQIKGAVSGGRGGTYTTTDTLTVTINAPAKQDTGISNVSGGGTYGGDANLTAKLSSGSNNLSGKNVAFELNGRAMGTDATDANGVAELGGASLSGIDAGSHTGVVSANFTGDSGYNGSSGSGNLSVAKAATTTEVTCGAGPFTYDGTAKTPCSASVSGAGGLNESLPVGYQGNVNAGQATASASYAASANHLGSSDSKSFSIAKAIAVIDVRGFSGAYDGTAKGASGTAKGADGSNLNSLLDLGAKFTNVPGGTADWSFAGDSNHEPASGSVAISIAKAKVAINLSGLSKTYDGSPQGVTADTTPDVPNKQLTVTYDGGTRVPADAGSYRVVASLNDANYEASDATGTLTIARKALSVTANDASREYGDPNPVLAGLLSGDVAADNISASYSTAATKASDVGAYPIITSLNDPDNRLSNYDVTKTNGTLTVTKALLGAQADNANKVYGDALGAADLTGTLAGVKNGDPIAVSYSSAGAAASSDVGAYPIVPALDATAAVLANYHDPGLTNGTLRVTKAPLVIKADDASRFYGDPNPAFTGSVVSGVKNNDALNLSFTTPALQNSPIGTYAIVPEAGGAKAGNYLVSARNGVLTVGSWSFKGFYQPVDMSGTLNTVKGGSTVPIKFELFKGATELTDTASIAQPLRATKVACDSGATVDEIELVATGATALRYDATAGQFVYNWKTPTGAGTCYKVTLTANDGSSQTANFRLK